MEERLRTVKSHCSHGGERVGLEVPEEVRGGEVTTECGATCKGKSDCRGGEVRVRRRHDPRSGETGEWKVVCQRKPRG